jgi:hypothetical protein
MSGGENREQQQPSRQLVRRLDDTDSDWHHIRFL